MNSTTIAVDLAKTVFEVAVSEHPGQRERHRFSPRAWRSPGEKNPTRAVSLALCAPTAVGGNATAMVRAHTNFRRFIRSPDAPPDRPTPRITCRRKRAKPAVAGQVHADIMRHLPASTPDSKVTNDRRA